MTILQRLFASGQALHSIFAALSLALCVAILAPQANALAGDHAPPADTKSTIDEELIDFLHRLLEVASAVDLYDIETVSRILKVEFQHESSPVTNRTALMAINKKYIAIDLVPKNDALFSRPTGAKSRYWKKHTCIYMLDPRQEVNLTLFFADRYKEAGRDGLEKILASTLGKARERIQVFPPKDVGPLYKFETFGWRGSLAFYTRVSDETGFSATITQNPK